MTFMASRACSSDTPGRSRATAWKKKPPLFNCEGTTKGTSAGRGTQIWNGFSGKADAASGRTPMIV